MRHSAATLVPVRTEAAYPAPVRALIAELLRTSPFPENTNVRVYKDDSRSATAGTRWVIHSSLGGVDIGRREWWGED